MADVELPNPEEITEQGKDRFTKAVALTVACYAVVLALASLGGSNAAKETNINQQKATNTWAYYQAKVIREHAYRIAKLNKELELESLPPERRASAQKLLERFAKEEVRYGGDKEEIQKEARGYEKERDINLRKDPYFDYAEVMLQIAIVLASVSMLANSRATYLASLLVALAGAVLTYNGFFLKFAIAFLEGDASQVQAP